MPATAYSRAALYAIVSLLRIFYMKHIMLLTFSILISLSSCSLFQTEHTISQEEKQMFATVEDLFPNIPASGEVKMRKWSLTNTSMKFQYNYDLKQPRLISILNQVLFGEDSSYAQSIYNMFDPMLTFRLPSDCMLLTSDTTYSYGMQSELKIVQISGKHAGYFFKCRTGKAFYLLLILGDIPSDTDFWTSVITKKIIKAKQLGDKWRLTNGV